MKEYFTRLTPNFNDWKCPSGIDGKCKLKEKSIYEGRNGFGWEEWLFKDYHLNNLNPDFECKGFVEAMNQQNMNVQHIDRLHLYTIVCKNSKKTSPGIYYVGYIDNVNRIALPQNSDEIVKELKGVKIENKLAINKMLSYSINISFKVKDLHVNFNKVSNQPIKLEQGQYRFGLYNLQKHIEFLPKIKGYF